MNKDKIIQIIPAPANMWAKYDEDYGDKRCDALYPVVCLALMEDAADGSRYVHPMIATGFDGLIDFIDDFTNFSEIVFTQ